MWWKFEWMDGWMAEGEGPSHTHTHKPSSDSPPRIDPHSARATLEYAAIGRHLGFCCDRCGATDFTGPRYKCSVCVDYDLCQACRGAFLRIMGFGGLWWMVDGRSVVGGSMHIFVSAVAHTHTSPHTHQSPPNHTNHPTVLPVERHRYRFGGRRWTKEEYSEHADGHAMVVIQALPHDAGLLQRFAPV